MSECVQQSRTLTFTDKEVGCCLCDDDSMLAVVNSLICGSFKTRSSLGATEFHTWDTSWLEQGGDGYHGNIDMAKGTNIHTAGCTMT